MKQIIFILTIFASTLVFSSQSLDQYSDPLTQPVKRQIRFVLTIQNPSSKALNNQKIYIYAPVKRTATQMLEKLDINMAYQLQEDALQNQIVVLSFDNFAPYATKIVTIKADLLLSAQPTATKLTKPDIYMVEEPFIEVSDHQIQATAKQLVKKNISDTAYAIYDWTKKNMSYAGYVAEDLGARYAISHRRGDCTEYAYLVTALARANQIPSRVLGGYVVNRNTAPQAHEYHNWSEIYIQDKWRLVDAEKGNWQRLTENYIAMRIISNEIKNPLLGNAHRFKVEGELLVTINEK